MEQPSTPSCRNCGSPLTGPFCAQCGASAYGVQQAPVHQVPPPPPPTIPPAASHRSDATQLSGRRLALIGGILVAVIAAVAIVVTLTQSSGTSDGGSEPAAAASTVTIRGTLTVTDIFDDNNNCGGIGINRLGQLVNGKTLPCESLAGGYSDIGAGTQVTVTDSTGRVLAVGSLESGKVAVGGASFPFTVTGVPKTNFYGIEVSHRGAVNYSAKDVESPVSLSLG